jgi:DNA gyrase subunit B
LTKTDSLLQATAPRKAIQDGYDAHSIVVLSGVDAIRKRASLYVGSTGTDGLHQLAFELIENAMDEFLAGECRNIYIVLHEDLTCSVADDGRGIPVAIHPQQNRPTAELLLTQLHSGGKFSGYAYSFSGGLHGLGLTCVNALSERLTLEVWRDGNSYIQEFSQGVPQYDLRNSGPTSRRGTRLRFLPDPAIFGNTGTFSYDRIAGRLRELAFLNAGVKLHIEDAREGRRDEFCFQSGVKGLLEDINRHRKPLHETPIYFRETLDSIVVEAALQWTSSFSEEVASFVNAVHTQDGGSHVEGLKHALKRAITEKAISLGLVEKSDDIITSDVVEGLGAVLSVRVSEPQYDSQTKSQLIMPAVAAGLARVLSDALTAFFDESAQVAHIIIGKVLEAQKARLSARRASLPTRYLRQEMAQSLAVYRQQFGIRSKNWHESCRWLTDPGLLQAHAEMCDVDRSARMLDVCCGSGIVGGSFGDRVTHKVGLDITPQMRQLAQLRLDEVREGSVYDIPFAKGSFDIVVTREVLHLLPEAQQALSEILRVLRPGGQMIFGQTVPYGAVDAAWTFRIFKKKQPLFCNNFLAEDLQKLLANVGFDRIKMNEYLLWEPIDLWIDTYETTALHRQEIRELYYKAPDDVKEIHPFEIGSDGKIRDQWRWCIFSARKPE